MTFLTAHRTGEIVPFRKFTHPPHRLTMADRIEALQWGATKAAQICGRLVFHRWSSADAHEGGEYISIYRGDDGWAAWGATRRGPSISVWRCATGADIGNFPTMREALSAVKTISSREGSGSRGEYAGLEIRRSTTTSHLSDD